MKYIIAILFFGLLVGCSEEALNNQQICEQSNGIFNAEFNECVDISKDICDDMNGQFNECASACRHEPEAEICTMQCIPVCTLS